MDYDELEYSGDLYYWGAVVIAIAKGEISIKQVKEEARKDMLEDVEHYKLTGELCLD